ncbi:MAG: hypothetical protein U1C33_05260 [Candidatus Cloacimonadaceae bacterium]|nr:hypothetical protein [Candidatus Cloacimonadaceae bacterium]
MIEKLQGTQMEAKLMDSTQITQITRIYVDLDFSKSFKRSYHACETV